MNKLKFFFLFLVAAVIVTAQGFEGYVKYKVEGEGETSFLKYYKKGQAVRMEPEAGQMQMGGAILFKEGKTYVLMPAQNMYMEFGDEMYNMMGQSKQSDESEDDYEKPTKTGETKDILGYTCEKWVFEDENYTTEVWAAKDLGEFVLLSVPMAKDNMPGWYEDISDGGFFPMLVEAKDKSGNVGGRMEVVDIKEEPLADNMFEIPSNYTQFKMPGGN